MAEAPATKTCHKCKTDCAGKPRVKDPHGRYFCKPCHEALAVAAPPPPDPDDEIISLIDTAPPLPAKTGLAMCPSCGSSVPHGAAICVQCGLDLQKGSQLRTDKTVPKEETAVPPRQGKCGKCGYSIKGLKVPRCPECGTIIGRMTDRERRNQDSAAAAKRAYVKPFIQIAIGLIGAIAIASGVHGPGGALGALIAFGAFYAVVSVIFFICGMLWIGFDSSMHLIALRLAGVCALITLITFVVGFIPIGIVRLGIVAISFIGIMADSMEVEMQDAVIVGIVSFGAWFVLQMILIAWLMSMA